MKSSTPTKAHQPTTRHLLIFILGNGFAGYFIPRFLSWAHYVINGLFIPRRFFYSVTRPSQDMTPLYVSMLLIVALELTGLLMGLHWFNRKYSPSLLGRRTALVAQLTTLGVGLVVTSLTVKEMWYLIEKL